jgi:hypothetical protein
MKKGNVAVDAVTMMMMRGEPVHQRTMQQQHCVLSNSSSGRALPSNQQRGAGGRRK